MSLTKPNLIEKIIFLSKKQFGIYRGLTNRGSIAADYRNYLFAVGKPDTGRLTNLDIYKIDNFLIK